MPSKAMHGGLKLGELRRLGLDARDVVDFSASINPLGPPPSVQEALAGVDLSCYPDPDCLALREALSANLGPRLECITIGNGSTELIHLLARACLAEGDKAFILSPTFGEYQVACSFSGAVVACLYASEKSRFRWDLDSVCRRIEDEMPRLVFLCNPNNPTGVYLSQAEVSRLASAGGGGLLVVDEAYITFVEGSWDALNLLDYGNVVILRSMTKDYALTGLRLGYAVAPEEVSHLLSAYQPAWSVNALAQAAGLAALSEPQHLAKAKQCVSEGKDYLERELSNLGLVVVPSAANFILVEVQNAAMLRAELLQKGVCVRDCTSFGLPRHIRVAARTVADCQLLVGALKEVKSLFGLEGETTPGDPGNETVRPGPEQDPHLQKPASNTQGGRGGVGR